MSRSSRTIYVGNLPGDIREKEVENLFRKYGPVAHIDLKIPPRPPGYAFVEFEDVRDAADAIYGRDGYKFDGRRLRVNLAHGGRRHPSSTDKHNSHNSGQGPHDGVSRQAVYQVLIEGFPHCASWQDFKDHIGPGIDACLFQFIRDKAGTSAIVDLESDADMQYAISLLDGSCLRRQNSNSTIRVKEYVSRPGSQNRSRSRGRSLSRSPSRSRSKKTPSKKRSRRSRSRSRGTSTNVVCPLVRVVRLLRPLWAE